MTPDDRRYSDDDARRILALAAEVEAPTDRPWTLAELQRVGAEAGLAPTAVAAAARALAQHPTADEGPTRAGHWLGLPVAVSHAVPLARPLSDAEWERLVARCRETFAANGRLRVDGGRREWRVGNLRVAYDASEEGGLLDLRTRKGDARLLPQLGLMFLLVAAGLAMGAAGEGGPRLGVALTMALAGVAFVVAGLARLPMWARARERQFATLAADAQRLAGR